MSNTMIIDKRDYPLGSIRRAEVELMVKSGSLIVHGGSPNFCSAVFEYSHQELRPIDDFDHEDDEARLEITQPSTDGLRDAKSDWNVQLNSEAQLKLDVSSMSGSVSLDLDRVRVAHLDVESMSGAVRVHLGGDYPELDEIALDSASGQVAVRLDGSFPTLSEIEIDSKSGKVDLAIAGDYPNLKRIAVDSKSGAVDLDIRGAFKRDDLGIRVDCVSGAVRVRVPSDIGASLNATTVSGRVRADGFTQGPGRRTNQVFDSTDATLWLNLHTVSGSVDVVSE